MLSITIPGREWFDEEKNEFVTTTSMTIQMEHSLLSLHEWEKKWKKPFFSGKEKTNMKLPRELPHGAVLYSV